MTKEEKDDFSSFKVFNFDGSDRTKFREWRIKSLAYGRRKKFAKAFTTDIYETETTDSLGNIIKQSSEEDIQARSLAMDYLLGSLTGSAFTMVTTETEEDPKLAWDLLLKEYEESGEEDYETVLTDLQTLTMKKNEKPSELRDRMKLINERLKRINIKYALDETQIKVQFLSKLTDDYDTLRQNFQTTMGGKTDLHTMVKDLDNRHKAIATDNKKGTSSVMNTEDKKKFKPKKQYKKTCGYCGKMGHMAKDCSGKKKDQEETSKSGKKVVKNMLCYNCRQTGHLSSDCPKKKGNDSQLFTAVFCAETEDKNEDDEYYFEVMEDENQAEDEHWDQLIDKLRDGFGFNDKSEMMKALDEEVMHMTQEDDWSQVKPKKRSFKPKEQKDQFVFANHNYYSSIANGDEDDDDFERYLVDSGATLHVAMSNEKMVNREPSTLEITVGNGNTLEATEKGDIGLMQKGTNTKIGLRVDVVPGMRKNILSVKRMQNAGWKIVMSHDEGYATNGNQNIQFEKGDDEMWYFVGKRFQIPTRAQVFDVDDGQWADSQPPPTEEQRKQYGKAMPTSMSYDDAHDRWGHKSKKLLDKTAKHYNIKLTGDLHPCEGCGLAMAKQKAVSKISLSRAEHPGYRLYLDAAGPFQETLGGSKYLFAIVDDFTRKGWIKTAAKKSQMSSFAKEVMTELKTLGFKTKHLRCDNAGENVNPLKKVCDEFEVQLELTAPYTPQMNGVVERRIPILITRANASMMTAQLNDDAKKELWSEAVNHQNDTENMTLSSVRDEPADATLYKDASKLVKYAQPFGRVGIVTIRRQFGSKWKQKGYKCVFVGYAKNHPADTYRMYNPVTKSIVQSRDVKFLTFSRPDPKDGMSIFDIDPEIRALPQGLDDTAPQTTFTPPEQPSPNIPNNHEAIQPGPHVIPDDGDTHDDLICTKPSAGRIEGARHVRFADEVVVHPNAEDREHLSPETSDDEQPNGTVEDDISSGEEDHTERNAEKEARQKAERLERELRKLDTSYNPLGRTTNETIEVQTKDGEIKEVNLHFVYAAAEILGIDPLTVKEAFNGPEADQWKESYKAEIQNFTQRKVWKKVKKEVAKKLRRKIMKSKVVFKRKNEPDGTIRYKTRVVSKGFLMETGVDYQESFSPVGNESSTRVVICIYLYNADIADEEKRFVLDSIDIDAAFLEGESENRLFMEFPDGLEEIGIIEKHERETHCAELLKSIYGNVDAALIFFRTYKKHLTEKMGLEQSVVDPCVFYKRDEEGRTILVAITHVDDTMLTGTRKAIEEFKRGVKQRFGYTEQDGFVKHLGVWYKEKRDESGETYLEADMHDTIDKVIQTFESITKHKPKKYNTPGTPGLSMERNSKDDDAFNSTSYRKIVGKIMYLTHKLMVEGSNAARELSRNFANPGRRHWKEVERFVGFLKENRSKIKITYRKPREMRVVTNVDSNYAQNTDRKSVSGAIHTIGGTLVGTLCKTQASVVGSSTEAELVAAALAVCEMKFLQMLLDEIYFVKKPGILIEDNTGCIFLIRNPQVGSRTKHIDVKYLFVRKEQETKQMSVIFCRSEENEADILTKNVIEKLYSKFATRLREGRLRTWVRWKEIVKQADDPIGFQREDVVNYVRTADRPSESSESFESVIQSELDQRVHGNVFYVYDE
jgi:hypothetical protein